MPTTLPMPRRAVVLRRGLARHCPNCGKGPLFARYLTLVDHCAVCGERLGHIRADDLPAYVTIFIVGHVVVGLMLVVIGLGIPTWFGLPVCLVLTVGLTLALLPRVKGVVAAHLWRLKIPRGSVEAESL